LQLATAFGDVLAAGGPDVLTAAAISALLLVVAVAACAVPAIRVSAVDPVSALRQE